MSKSIQYLMPDGIMGHADWHISIKDSIQHMLSWIGDDPRRAGLKDTPHRMVAAWEEMFAGYRINEADLFTTFDEPCDEMVICKDIEFYSTCEHHFLPFYGKAHIAYIPNGKVIGLSKLARVLDCFARRLQIQERIGQQVTAALDEHLHPKASACIIEAKHMCMCCRGVNKQNSVMITSSLTGAFRESPAARSELLQLVKG
jgi:GTP cyclohydrolase IA